MYPNCPQLTIINTPKRHTLGLYIQDLFSVAQMVKCLPTMQDTRVQSLVGKIPWKRKWQPTPVFLPGKSHGLRRLVGYSPWGRKESDTTGQLLLSFFFHFQCRTNDQKQPANRTLKHWDSMLLTALKLIYSRNREKYINICILACCSVAESCPTLCDPVD